MNLLISLFNTVLYQPLFNILILLYLYLPGHDFGIAIVVLTVLIKLVFYPLGGQAIRSQKALSELQPKIEEIQKKYKENKEEQAKATLDLYKKEKINPFSGCLPLLIQLPILIALYQVFWRGFQIEQMSYLYSFVSNPGTINPGFLGLVNLSQPNIFLTILAGIAQFIQSKMTIPKKGQATTKGRAQGMAGMMQKQMLYFFPALTVFILWKLPSAIGLYWVTTTVFSIAQQYFVFRKAPAIK